MLKIGFLNCKLSSKKVVGPLEEQRARGRELDNYLYGIFWDYLMYMFASEVIFTMLYVLHQFSGQIYTISEDDYGTGVRLEGTQS